MKHQLRPTDAAMVRRIAGDFSLDLLTATVLERRGFRTREDLKYFFEQDIVYQHSPFLFEDSFTVVERINSAIEEDESILVFGDRDTDGITATAIMVKELERMGAVHVSYRLPMDDEPYGLTMDLVDEIIAKGHTLLITVDNGISAIKEIGKLEEMGVDVIVLDHHIAGDEFPPALAILDPKIEGSGYPFSGLAGCMVAFKACYALRFSRTPLYQSRCILLHATLGNDTVRINAVKLENLIEIDRMTEEVTIGLFDAGKSRILKFLDCNQPIFVLDASVELKMLNKAFSNSVDVSLMDLRKEMEKVMPAVRGRTLFDLSLISKAPLYESGDKEMETLVSLFRSFSIYRQKELFEGIDELISLATLGTVADLMPLRDENRLFVKMGLRRMERNPSDGLRYLLSRLELSGRKLTARDISYTLAPVINSSGRLGRPDVALEFFLSDDSRRIADLGEMLLDMNRRRQKNTEEALEKVRDDAISSLSFFMDRMIMIEGGVPRGLTGSIASRFLSEFKKPVLVLAGMDDGRISASMRTAKGFDARAFLDNFSHLFQDFGGHSCAAGFSMDVSNLERLKAELSSFVLAGDADLTGPEEDILVDAEISRQYFDSRLWKLKEAFEPFGQENETLKFYTAAAEIYEVFQNRNGGSFLRCSVKIGDEIYPALWWDNDKEEGYFKAKDRVEMVFSPDVNFWKGIEKKQLMISAMDKLG